MKRTLITSTATAALLIGSANAAITYTYDMDDIGAAGSLLSSDSWAGTDLSNWVTNNFNGNLYSRNQNDGDNYVSRLNDGGFSYSIPASSTSLILEMDVRSGAGFWQAGISNGTNTVLGIGSDFNLNNQYFILDGGTRRFEAGTTATGDSYNTLRLEFNLETGTADLILNPDGANTLLIDDVAITNADGTSLSAADSLYIRTSTRYSGVGEFRLTVIPEPSTTALAALGFCGILLRRRRA